jgi:hypothetical protein
MRRIGGRGVRSGWSGGVAGEPGDAALDLPAVSAETVAGVDAAAGDAEDHAALAQPGPVGGGVIGQATKTDLVLTERPSETELRSLPASVKVEQAWVRRAAQRALLS